MQESLEQQRDRLVAENAELREQQRKIAALVNHMAHELRTPLTSIHGFSEFLFKHAARQTPEKLHSYCEILFLESSRLTRLVDNLLNLSRIRAGKLGLSLAPVSFGAIAERSLRNLELQAAEKKITLSSGIEPELPFFQADPDKLQQVLTNLLANAIHYSPQGSSVEIGARLDGARLLAWVRDNGIGIAPQDQERIFDEFYRVESESAASVKGTGLGLPISKTLIELHGGRIWVQSEPGRGSTFFFTVPLSQKAMSDE
jgi:signal transduction histidine kinase